MTHLIKFIILLFIVFSFACTDEDQGKELPRIISTGNPAIDGLTAKIASHPDDPKLFAERAAAYYEMKGYDEAIADMANALRLDSNNVAYHYLLADVYLDYYKSQQALATMERAVKIDPQNIESLLKLAEFQLFLKQHESSLKTIDRVLRLNKNNAQAYVFMGLNFELTGDDARAINSYQSAIENDPGLAEVHMKLGQLFAKSGNKIAIRYFDNAIAADPNNVMTMYAKAEYLHNNDRLDEALEVLREAVLKDHQFVEAYFRTGVIYLEKDSLDKAYEQFNLVVQNDPTSAKGFYYRGLSSEMRGNLTNAKADYEQALTFLPDYEKAKEALKRFNQEK